MVDRSTSQDRDGSVFALTVIVFAQFAGTSLWFAGNAVFSELNATSAWPSSLLGLLTSSIQLGFVAGTLAYAFAALGDRISPTLVFLVSVALAALANALVAWVAASAPIVLLLRFLTGFFLAGVYPVGMQIAARCFPHTMSRAIGYLVGALVLGTAFPFLLKSLDLRLPWRVLLLLVSALALVGGIVLVALIRLPSEAASRPRPDLFAMLRVFRSREFRSAAFGYFGHMWELYAFWATLPLLFAAYSAQRAGTELNSDFWSFAVIAMGAAGCAGGGVLALRYGSARTAAAQLLASGSACLLLPFAFGLPPAAFVALLLVWGLAVVGDSPQFSTLNARHAPQHLVATGLTTVTCIGFAITIGSIELVVRLAANLPIQWVLLVLVPGPCIGLLALRPLLAAEAQSRASVRPDNGKDLLSR